MTARKSARKTVRKSARKTARKSSRKSARPRRRTVLEKAAKRIRAVGKKAADVGEAAVRKGTGKGWREWFALLDRAGAKVMDRRGIVAVLEKARGLSGWWRQTITVAYERARGLRRKYQTASGSPRKEAGRRKSR